MSETDDPEDPLTIAADAWAARQEFDHDPDDDERLAILEAGSDVHEIEARHDAELDRIITPSIPARSIYDQLTSIRNAEVYAHARRKPAVGFVPYEGFIEPESAETHTPDPKPATSFTVERKPRRPIAPK